MKSLLSVLLVALVASVPAPAAEPTPASPPAATEKVREIEIVVRDGAYTPSRVEVRAGERVRLRFVRREWSSCTREVVLGWLGIRRELPTDVPVAIDLPPLQPGTYGFECGMGMAKGAVVVVPKEVP